MPEKAIDRQFHVQRRKGVKQAQRMRTNAFVKVAIAAQTGKGAFLTADDIQALIQVKQVIKQAISIFMPKP